MTALPLMSIVMWACVAVGAAYISYVDPPPRWKWTHLAWPCLVLLTVMTCWPSLSGDFIYEDANWMPYGAGGWPVIRSVTTLLSTVAYLPWHVAFAVGNGDPRPYHGILIAMHLLNGYLLYRLVRQFTSEHAGLCAAAIFLLHPLNRQAVAYVTSGRETVAGMWLLLALTAALTEARWTWARAALVTCCGGVMLFTKSSAFMGLALIPYVVWCVGDRRFLWRRLLPVWCALGLLAFPQLLNVLKLSRIDEGQTILLSPAYALEYISYQITALWRYLLMVPIPLGLSLDHDFYAVNWAVRAVAVCGFVWVGLGCVLYRKTWPLSSATFGFLLLALLPRFVIQQEELLNEGQMLIPMIAMCATSGIWIAQRLDKRAVRCNPAADGLPFLYAGPGDPLWLDQ